MLCAICAIISLSIVVGSVCDGVLRGERPFATPNSF
jgi:hypothetical protein